MTESFVCVVGKCKYEQSSNAYSIIECHETRKCCGDIDILLSRFRLRYSSYNVSFSVFHHFYVIYNILIDLKLYFDIF